MNIDNGFGAAYQADMINKLAAGRSERSRWRESDPLILDAFAGVSGDMFVGALLDAGADLEAVRCSVKCLNLEGIEIRATKVMRQGLVGTKFDVLDPSHRPERG